MRFIAFAKKAYAALAEYERRLDYDPNAHLSDRVQTLEQEVAKIKRQTNDIAVSSEISATNLAPATTPLTAVQAASPY